MSKRTYIPSLRTLGLVRLARAVVDNLDLSSGAADGLRYDLGLEDEDRLTQRALMGWARDRVANAYYDRCSLFDDGATISVWRMITAPIDWTPNARHPGIYWSFEENAADSHWGVFSSGYVKWLLCAQINPAMVDWAGTLVANSCPCCGEAEKEIRLLETAAVKVASYGRVPRLGDNIQFHWQQAA